MLEGYFSLDGRVRRWRFFVYSLALWIIIPVLILLAMAAVNNAHKPFAAGLIAFIVIGSFAAWAGLALVVKRLHDLDKSGWHYVWMFMLPGSLGSSQSIQAAWASNGQWSLGFGAFAGIIPLIAFIYLVLARGTDGPNKFGYPP